MARPLQCAGFLRDDYATNRTWQHVELPIACQSKGKNSKSVVSPIAAHACPAARRWPWTASNCRQRSMVGCRDHMGCRSRRPCNAGAEIVAVEKAGAADQWRRLRLCCMGSLQRSETSTVRDRRSTQARSGSIPVSSASSRLRPACRAPANMASQPKKAGASSGSDGFDRQLQAPADGFGNIAHRHAFFGDRVIFRARLRLFQRQPVEARDVRNMRRRPAVASLPDIGGHALLARHRDRGVMRPCLTGSWTWGRRMTEARTPFSDRAVCSETRGNGKSGGTSWSSVAG